jgi:uncharacterized protein (TIGR03435 family)
LKALLAKAYGLRPDQISGPAWMDSDLFSVNAIVPEAAPTDEVPAMLQSLLRERFRMTTHSEMKEELIYGLSAGKSSSKPKPSSSEASQSREGCTIDAAGQAQMKFMGTTMTQFANRLSILLHRSVIDGTALSDRFNITLPVDVEDLQIGAQSVPTSLLNDMQTAGLQLKSERAPVKHLIVDKAQEIPLET